ncbi:MAG: extracellular solute-binding protein [Caldilinea sp. CFX5]|nr:extracellular solute-binding protein [Caldilinea sp. CFX5]
MNTFFKSFYLNLLIGVILIVSCIGVVVYLLQRTPGKPPTLTVGPLGTPVQESITVYSALPEDLVHNYLARFQAEHPAIEVRLVTKVTLALFEQLLAEQEAPQADVIWGLAVTNMLPLEWNHLLTSYAPKGVEQVTPLFRDANEPPQWVGISARSVAFCANTAILAQLGLPPPESWEALLDPQYKGQLLIPTPGQTSVGYLLIGTILQNYGVTQGWEYLAQLHENTEGRYANNASGVCDHVRNGEYAIGVTYDYRAFFPDDKNMAFLLPEECAGWEMEVNALVRKETIKPAAKLFLDWAISDSAMTEYAKDRILTGTDIQHNGTAQMLASRLSADTVRANLFDLDIPWIAANRERIQTEWMTRFDANLETIDTR